MISFDNTISLGNLVQSIFYIVVMISAFYGLKQELSAMKIEIKYIQENHRAITEAFTQLGKVLTQVAVQDSRIIMLEKYIDELRHGLGFIRKTKGSD